MVNNFLTKSERREVNQRNAMDEMLSSLHGNSSRITEEISGTVEAVREVERSNSRIAADLAKAMNSQTVLVSKLQVSVDSLNQTLQAALGQSLDAMQDANGTAAKITESIHTSVAQMNALADKFTSGVKSLEAMNKMRKKAIRNQDGSWFLEPT